MIFQGAAGAPRFDHLQSLTRGPGLFEHALLSRPRPEHGYCLDDVSRALVVVCRQRAPDAALQALQHRYLDFILSAIQPDGRCHNRMRVDGRWNDRPGLGDWWGRALWGLGVASRRAPSAGARARALHGFRKAARARPSPYLRACVFAALGAGEVLLLHPGEACARELLASVVDAVAEPATEAAAVWPWPQDRLTYANGSVVEALLIAGSLLPDPAALQRGLNLLDFLIRIESRQGHLSVTPVGGRGHGEDGPAFDQQPIEVAALADCCARAFDITGSARWREGVRMSWAWFLGDNDAGTAMVDLSTGAGYDGLHPDGRNLNQGAESTLAAISTAQQARRLGVLDDRRAGAPPRDRAGA